jgi:methionyl aminopeptidase
MIEIKSLDEIKIIKEGGKRLSLVMKELLKKALPEIRLYQIEELALKLLKQQGLEPNFNKISNYKWATCINVNNGIVHGVPGDYRINEGDLVSIDTGGIFKGFHTDMARTVIASLEPKKYKEKMSFLSFGQEALKEALKISKKGKRIADISQAIEKSLKKNDLVPVDSFVGHGIGRKLHEDPQIPGFLNCKIKESPLIKQGMVFCIEVIYCQKGYKVKIAEDGWTAFGENIKMAGLFEDMVAITDKSSLVLTKI